MVGLATGGELILDGEGVFPEGVLRDSPQLMPRPSSISPATTAIQMPQPPAGFVRWTGARWICRSATSDCSSPMVVALVCGAHPLTVLLHRQLTIV